MSQHEDQTRAAGRRLFEDAVETLDAGTTRRLRLMRREALSATRPSPVRRFLPAAAFAVGVLALGLAWRMDRAPASVEAVPAVDAPLAVDLAADEDAELYAWLGEAPVAAGDEAL